MQRRRLLTTAGRNVVTPVSGRRAARRAQRGRVAAHLEAEAAVDLQVDEAGRDDVGVQRERAVVGIARAAAPVRTSTIRPPSTISTPGTSAPSSSSRPATVNRL